MAALGTQLGETSCRRCCCPFHLPVTSLVTVPAPARGCWRSRLNTRSCCGGGRVVCCRQAAPLGHPGGSFQRGCGAVPQKQRRLSACAAVPARRLCLPVARGGRRWAASTRPDRRCDAAGAACGATILCVHPSHAAWCGGAAAHQCAAACLEPPRLSPPSHHHIHKICKHLCVCHH